MIESTSTRGILTGVIARHASATLFVLLLLFACTVESVSARKGSGPDDLKAQARALSEDLRNSRQRYDAATARARAAAASEATLSSGIASARTALAELSRRVERNRIRARQAERSLVRARADLSRRMVEVYMTGSPVVADLLLASADYGVLASRTLYLEAIRDADRALAGRVADLRRVRVAALTKVRADRAEADARLGQLEVQLAEVSSVKAEAESAASRLASIEESRSAEIGRLRNRIEAIEVRDRTEGRPATASFPGGPYSIPTYIVMCESGGNYSALNPSSGAGGAYQIIPSTWEAYGGKGLPHEASKAEQDRIAALIWANDGPGAWVCS